MKHLIVLLFCSLSLIGQENNAILCADGIDNDGNGLIDCEDNACFNLITSENGCSICPNGLSFGDYIISHTPGCNPSDTELNGALGVNDFDNPTSANVPEFVFLGNGGILKIGFNNNLLTNSGDSNEDIRFFEIGPAVEPFNIALRPFDLYTKSEMESLGIQDINADGFYEIAVVDGAISALDIDFILAGYEAGSLLFDAIEITDVLGDYDNCNRNTPGSDIDAVCALFSLDLNCDLPPENISPNDICDCLDESSPYFEQFCITNNLIFIPNAFTPDNSGHNDKFQVFTKNNILVNIKSYCIFNRWGEMVFKNTNFISHSIENYWDGKIKNQNADIGVYIYVIETVLENGQQINFKGNVTLLR